jgi:hypothetical protein
MSNPKTPPGQKSKAESGAALDEEIDESFPASDPPSSNAGGRIGEPRRDKDKVAPKPGK